MSHIYKDITEMVGNTPLVQLNKVVDGLSCRVLAKVESRNPAFSVKDRLALSIIRAAEASGELKPGGTIVEATSGNTGIGLAAMGAALGYRVIIVMPSSMSVERRIIMRAYGAELVLTDEGGVAGAVNKSVEIASQIPGAILARQFENPANLEIHRRTTGPEIWRDTDGQVDAFVAGFGTGGTFSGVTEVLKGHNPSLLAVAVEPAESPLVSQGHAGPHKIQGLGANLVPQNFKRELADEIMTITSDEALEMSRRLAKEEGLLVGISAGANVAAALKVAARPELAGKTLVTVLPDTGERYLSTALYSHLAD